MHSFLAPEKIQELLGRRPVLNVFDAAQYVRKKAVLVTGAGGSIGSELCRQIVQMKPKVLILYEMSEFALYQIERRLQEFKNGTKVIPVLGNLSSWSEVRRLLKAFDVETVYHAAAYKHVPMVERNPIAGLRNNVWGAKVLVDAARDCKIKNLVVVSTDKAVNPTNVMGASKRLAEYVTLCGNSPFKVVRFGNVLWSNGSVLPLFYEQLTEGKKVTITHPGVDRYFMSIGEAVDLILQSTALSAPICVLNMGEPIQIELIAARLAQMLGKGEQDWEVEYIGLRPGEKLHEELTLGERLQPTMHPYIQYAQEEGPSYEELDHWLQEIAYLCDAGDVGGLRRMLQTVIPGYAPSCGIADEVWLEENVVRATQNLDDCYSPASPTR